MTVKDVVSILKFAKTIVLGWNGHIIHFDKDDLLQMDAYGKYIVESVQAVGDDEDAYYEVNIAMIPVKAGA
jgi:hypothetical protein